MKKILKIVLVFLGSTIAWFGFIVLNRKLIGGTKYPGNMYDPDSWEEIYKHLPSTLFGSSLFGIFLTIIWYVLNKRKNNKKQDDTSTNKTHNESEIWDITKEIIETRKEKKEK